VQEKSINIILHKPKGERPNPQKIQGPDERRTMTNPNPNTTNQCNTYADPF
jgi:hypothetical protein